MGVSVRGYSGVVYLIHRPNSNIYSFTLANAALVRLDTGHEVEDETDPFGPFLELSANSGWATERFFDREGCWR